MVILTLLPAEPRIILTASPEAMPTMESSLTAVM
jgi:hypothetical protein